MSQVDPDPSDQLLETLKSELHNCQMQSNQAHIFLSEICNRLQSTQELINEYKLSAKLKDDRIAKLEKELKLKSQQLENVDFEHEELKKRIKSEKHNASQYKAALHRCLDTSHLSGAEAKQVYTQARKLTHSSPTFEDSLPKSPNHHQENLALNPISPHIEAPKFIQDIKHQQPSPKVTTATNKSEISISQANSPVNSAIAKDGAEGKPKSFAAINLPQFAPLKPR